MITGEGGTKITMSDRTDIDAKNLKSQLMKRRRELLKLIEGSSEAVKPVDVDQTTQGRLTRMDALQSQAMDLEIDRRRHQEISRIESALQRIEEGKYGYCTACGDDIAAKRLENDPTTPVCINCAKEAVPNG